MIDLVKMQRFVAQLGIGSSAARKQGAPDVLRRIRDFLATLPLQQFAASNEQAFRGALNAATGQLKERLPEKAQSWGLARKCINIHLRDAFYNTYLRSAYGLQKAESWYEVPLDEQVSTGLRKKAGRGALPRWKGIKNLSPDESEKYQQFAIEYARQENLPARVHLDLILWRPQMP